MVSDCEIYKTETILEIGRHKTQLNWNGAEKNMVSHLNKSDGKHFVSISRRSSVCSAHPVPYYWCANVPFSSSQQYRWNCKCAFFMLSESV